MPEYDPYILSLRRVRTRTLHNRGLGTSDRKVVTQRARHHFPFLEEGVASLRLDGVGVGASLLGAGLRVLLPRLAPLRSQSTPSSRKGKLQCHAMRLSSTMGQQGGQTPPLRQRATGSLISLPVIASVSAMTRAGRGKRTWDVGHGTHHPTQVRSPLSEVPPLL